jgi:hypothetical protein
MNKETQFLQRLSHAKMTRAEKTRQRSTLMAYADSNPVAEAPVAPTFFSILVSSSRFPLYATLMSIIVIGSGASTLAAEGSVPGDVFYGIKIHVNEPLMSALSPTAEGQARVSAELAARRVDEVVTLASTGRLTDEKQEYLDTAFTTQVEKTRAHVETLHKDGNTHIADDVTSELASHLAGEAQALGAVQAPTAEKTKLFLRKVLAISEEDSHEPLDTEGNDSQDTGDHIGAAQVALLASTSATSTAKSKKAITLRRQRDGGTRTLRITATTTLNRIFESSSHIVPKTDRAISTEEEGEKKGLDEALRLGQ